MTHPIVVGVDTTADSLAALNTAAELAHHSGAPLIAVHVRHQPRLVAESPVADGAAAVLTALDEIETATREHVTDVMAGRPVGWRLDVTVGEPAAELIKEAVDNHATTIVVGGRNHGVVGGLVLGSVAQQLVRKSPVSVLVVRDGHTHQVKEGPDQPRDLRGQNLAR
jgi:nucleotide-binding universal stress UspA family protein